MIRDCWDQQVEPQLAYLPTKVARIGLAESLGLLGEQADEKVGAAEVPVAKAFEPGPDLRLDLDAYNPLMHRMVYAFDAIATTLSTTRG